MKHEPCQVYRFKFCDDLVIAVVVAFSLEEAIDQFKTECVPFILQQGLDLDVWRLEKYRIEVEHPQAIWFPEKKTP